MLSAQLGFIPRRTRIQHMLMKLRGRPYTRLNGLGAESASTVLVPPMTMGAIVWSLLSTAGVAASAYHGYRRHDSIGWGILWAIAGGLIPIVTVPIAFAQGFGKKAAR